MEGGSSLQPSGLVDLHCHGAVGYEFDTASLEGIGKAVGFHRDSGTAAMLLSLVSAPIDRLVERLRDLRGAAVGTAGVVGVHLEGPFIAAARKGAHDIRALTVPRPWLVEKLIEAGGGSVRYVTLAPELPGALEAIDRFVAAGVVVGIGHTEADRDTAARAFDRGATLLTHAFNAMPGMHHRDPGPVGAALSRDHVVLELIADGFHVDPILIRALFAAAPGRVALVTDAMAATGLGDGEYTLGGLAVTVQEGRPSLTGQSTLAGSTVTLAQAIQVAVAAGIPRNLAVAAATEVPALVLGLCRNS